MKLTFKKNGLPLMSVLLAAVLILSSCGKQNSSSSGSSQIVPIPDVTGMTLEQAQNAAEKVGYIIQVTDTQWNDQIAKDCVLKQNPPPGGPAGDGGILSVVVSKGPQTDFVSDVANLQKEAAIAELESLGFKVECTEEYSDLAPGAVIRQNIEPGQAYKLGGTIKLVISKGLKSIETGKEVIVPSVTGKSFNAAKSDLNKLGLYIVAEKKEYSSTVPKDSIISQKQASGSKLLSGQTVHVTLSQGPEKARVPDVMFKTRSEAEQMLVSVKLKIKIIEEESDLIQEGNVIRQKEAAGTLLDVGAEITVYISISKTVEMPDIGMITRQEAQQLLAKLKLVPSFVEAYSDNVASGYVMAQNKLPGTRLKAGSTVIVTISKGKEKVAVPDLRGKNSFDALNLCVNAGFYVESTGEFSDTIEENKIISQNPAPGTKIDKGGTVRYVVSLGKAGGNTVLVPDVVGKTRADAEAQLRGASLQVNIKEIFSDSVDAGKVISQDISAGTSVNKNQLVIIVVSLGQEKVAVPDLVGFTTPDVDYITRLKLKLAVTEEYNDSVTAGLVFYQSVPAGTEVVIWTTVTIKISLGRKPVAVESVKLNQTSATVEYSFTLTATVTPNNADDKNVVWTSSDSSIVTVSNGAVTLKGAGTATVTASCGGKSASCTVTVLQVSTAASSFQYKIVNGEAVITRYVGYGTDIVIPLSLGGARVTKIDEYAFNASNIIAMKSVKSVYIPDGVTEFSGECSFKGCVALETVRMPESLKKIAKQSFANCTSLKSIYLPNGLERIDENAFFNCRSLTEVSIPASVTFIGRNVFLGCDKLTAINVNASNANYCSKDGVLFTKDMKLLMGAPHQLSGHYIIPNGVETIEYQSMRSCPNLTAVTIPASVKTIRELAFVGSGITAVYFEGNAPTTEVFIFDAPFPTVYYKAGKTGFGAKWNNCTTQVY